MERFYDWEEAIIRWQEPILTDSMLPDWFKSALFNELYYVVDGSTTWVEYDETWTNEEPLLSTISQNWFKKYGRFAYMECKSIFKKKEHKIVSAWEYYMYNTYDVHFYASWALLQNWPALEMSIQFDFSLSFILKKQKDTFQLIRCSDKIAGKPCQCLQGNLWIGRNLERLLTISVIPVS